MIFRGMNQDKEQNLPPRSGELESSLGRKAQECESDRELLDAGRQFMELYDSTFERLAK